jgi:beta-galactosidase
MVVDMRTMVLWVILVVGTSCSVTQRTPPDSSPRQRISFNKDWKFSLAADSSARLASFDDSSWRSLVLPHDWSIEGKFEEKNPSGVGGGALPGGTGWYRKKFRISDAEKGNRFYVEFDGVYCNSEVWINEHYLGKRPNGYISFHYDITPHLQYGTDNLIVVKADNSQQPNSRWYSGSGIYRNVWLTKTNPVHVDLWGTYVTIPNLTESRGEVSVQTKIVNTPGTPETVTIETTILDPSGNSVASVQHEVNLGKEGTQTLSQNISIENPALWSLEKPVLYTVRSAVRSKSKLLDVYETKTGLRSFRFDSLNGFFLNGKPVKILGVCNHHDLGALGAAINTRAIERQLEIMRGMGVNAIRTSHNPPAPELLDLCDKMGFIVMDEIFDMWKKGKSTHDYSNHWDEWHVKDLEDFVIRDRNHPSVIIWSIGNEIGEQWDSTGTRIANELAGIVRRLDSTRPITTGNNEVQPHNNIIKSGSLDLIGYNYNHRDYADFPKRYPGKKFIATETTSALATRGHYDMPSDSIRRWPISWDKIFTQGNPDNTVSAYDNVSAPWGSTHEETWKIMKKHPHLAGMFIWTGFDYLGEPTPYVWPSRSSYFGVVDLAGFPKDSYYLYQSEWTDKPMLHIFPHWNWQPGQTVDVWAYYNNADEAELFLNGISKGIRKKQNDDLHVMWRLAYEPGTVRVVTRKNGREVLTKENKTAGAPVKVVLNVDRNEISADENDLSFITVSIVDKEGNIVPSADNLVSFQLDGSAKIAAVDNGDPTSHDSFQASSRKAFHGLALLVVKALSTPGTVVVRASSPGLQSAEAKISLK